MNKALHEIWATSARRWRESAMYWNELAHETGDLLLSAFAFRQKRQAEEWAAEDEARAKEFAS